MVELEDLIGSFDASAPPSVGEQRIESFEKSVGFKMPEPLRKILLARDGGDLEPNYLVEFPSSNFAGGYGHAPIAQVFGIAREPWQNIRPLQEHFAGMEAEVTNVPPEIFVFADDWGGNVLTFNMRSGEIGFVDHETFGKDFTDRETYYVIAANFHDLLARMSAAEA
ncbi:SMI1/KNR4 family protein [Qipengyuania sphaerica]|uniref:SMI1/KNR4 family protein n=1 Tax=Qipengyuania sphaerica TaxID=2867243 RepID=UPI001C8675AA|nr:SMI1/KNR4 family protein [Qipengyuania sphaerica]MBX7539470.1 SMI1/KNR4 family protein [Qipengyuania sphaerica]